MVASGPSSIMTRASASENPRALINSHRAWGFNIPLVNSSHLGEPNGLANLLVNQLVFIFSRRLRDLKI